MEWCQLLTKLTSFASEVRSEIGRTTWPSRKEVMVTTSLVFLLAVIMAIFFSIIDQSMVVIMRSFL
ncbi:MAG: preprotein translocase subunit SecE [Acetobacteraceae bacterium]